MITETYGYPDTPAYDALNDRLSEITHRPYDPETYRDGEAERLALREEFDGKHLRIYGSLVYRQGTSSCSSPMVLTDDHKGQGRFAVTNGESNPQWSKAAFAPGQIPALVNRERGEPEGLKINLHRDVSDALRAEIIAEGWPLTHATRAEQSAATRRIAGALADVAIAYHKAEAAGEIDQ